MNDHTHFITNDGIIFTTRGDIHPTGFVRAVAVYFPSEKGIKEYNGIKYTKELDEFGEKMKLIKEKYVIENKTGNYVLVPERDIKKAFDPFLIFKIEREKLKKTIYKSLIEEIEKLVPSEDIGLIGSYLIGFSNEKSDIDLIIRGQYNLSILKREFSKLLSVLQANNDLDETKGKESIERYQKKYNAQYNNFSQMVIRRWPTIRTKEYLTKIRFCYKKEEIQKINIINFKEEVELKGEVVDDWGTNFMPRTFLLKGESYTFKIVTYFWDYSYCVKRGDFITVKGSLFEDNIILICQPLNHGITFNSL